MRIAALAILAITACACGARHDGPTVSPELQPYVSEFLSECDARGFGDHCRIRLEQMEALKVANLTGDDNGGCFREKDGTPHSLEVKAALPPVLLRAVTFHELGHCLLGMDHRDGDLTTEWVDMNPDHWTAEVWTAAVEGLFQPAL